MRRPCSASARATQAARARYGDIAARMAQAKFGLPARSCTCGSAASSTPQLSPHPLPRSLIVLRWLRRTQPEQTTGCATRSPPRPPSCHGASSHAERRRDSAAAAHASNKWAIGAAHVSLYASWPAKALEAAEAVRDAAVEREVRAHERQHDPPFQGRRMSAHYQFNRRLARTDRHTASAVRWSTRMAGVSYPTIRHTVAAANSIPLWKNACRGGSTIRTGARARGSTNEHAHQIQTSFTGDAEQLRKTLIEHFKDAEERIER